MAHEKKAAVLNEAEFRRVLTIAQAGRHGKRDATLLYFSFSLGLRAKELASLRLSDVLENGLRPKNEILLTSAHTKGGKKRLVYLMNKDARRALIEYIEDRQSDYQFSPKSPLFKSGKGGSFTPNTMQMLMKRLFIAAGFEDASSHSGRRTFATSLIERGVDIKAVSKLMGHSTINMTACYVDDNPVRLQRICTEVRLGVEKW
jgi:integrase/recombinase XerD